MLSVIRRVSISAAGVGILASAMGEGSATQIGRRNDIIRRTNEETRMTAAKVAIVTGGGTHNHNLLEIGPERGRSPWPLSRARWIRG